MSAKRLGLRDPDSTSLPDTDDQLEFTPVPVFVDGLNTSIFASASSRTTEEAAVLSAAAFATATAAIKGGPLSVFDTQLAALYYQASPLAAQMGAFTASVGHSDSALNTIGGTQYVTIDAVAKDGDGAALLAQLQAIGLIGGASFGKLAGGAIDVSKIADLLGVADLAFTRESGKTTHAGAVTTQADSAQHADTARATFGVDGTGIKVGILSDSFNRTNPVTASYPGGDNMASNIAGNDLPASTTILDEGPAAGATDEGRGMAQLVHDLAPGASIAFASAFNSFAGFASNIVALKNAGANVIVDDVQ
jgi:hypothetical protein